MATYRTVVSFAAAGASAHTRSFQHAREVSREPPMHQPLSATLMLTFFPGLSCDGCGALVLNTSLAPMIMLPHLYLILGGRDMVTDPR